jgi:hypothetical protein
MPRPELAIRVNGTWLQSQGAHGDLVASWSWPGGCKEASWVMTANYGSRLPLLTRGALVEVLWGGWAIWAGTLQEPDWNGRDVSLTASGLMRLGERYMAFDGSANTTDVASTAVDAAIMKGLPWIRHSSVPTTALASGTTDPVNSVAALLDAAAEKAGQRWGVDAVGSCFFAADPAAASLAVRPGVGDLGIADDNYASNVVLRHVTTTSTYRSAVYPPFGTVSAYEAKYGHSEFVRDITDRGPIADADADALAQKVYERSKQRPGWTNGLELANGEVMNVGGKALHPLWVAATGWGKRMRLDGVPDEVGLTSYTTFVVGGTAYAEGSNVVNVTPVGLVSRTQEDVLVELLEAMYPPEADAA